MSLNIKNDHVHALAKEAARRMGRSQTSVIEVALTRLLEDIDRADGAQGRRQRVDVILSDMQSRVRASNIDVSTENLYDEAGLPS